MLEGLIKTYLLKTCDIYAIINCKTRLFHTKDNYGKIAVPVFTVKSIAALQNSSLYTRTGTRVIWFVSSIPLKI